MKKEKTTYSVIEVIAINSIKQKNDLFTTKHFSQREIEELKSRHAQTKAGALAVKKALVKLCSALTKTNGLSEKSFVLNHKKNGALCIRKFPVLSVGSKKYSKKQFHISISHTRNKAYGLAVFQGELHE